MVINIKNKNQFVTGYLRPISALTDAVIFKTKDNKLECIANNEQGLIIYASYDLDVQSDLVLNIPNIKKLEKILSFIESDDIDLTYKENSLSYKDKKMRFKYHFLDDNIIQAPKLSVEKIMSLPYDIEFNIDSSKISELAKGAAFVAESEKLYINISESFVKFYYYFSCIWSRNAYIIIRKRCYTTNSSKFTLVRTIKIFDDFDKKIVDY